jgi:hypothetical protein
MRDHEGQMNDPNGRQAAEVGVGRAAAQTAVGFIVERSRGVRPRVARASVVRGTCAAARTNPNSGSAVDANGGATVAGIRMFAPDQAGQSAAGDLAGAIPCRGQPI